ncbi:hypothetical protein O6H91_Y428000 [Diphasiastrum complanatum]|nr:hypothetical protein O6H91_Y428000 [Diphasiastrum complanatum]
MAPEVKLVKVALQHAPTLGHWALPRFIRLFIVLSMLIGITGFGGVTLLLIEFLRKPKQFDQEETHAADSNQPAVYESMDILQENKICYGHRPDLDELFSEHETRRAAKNFGVFVCGSQSMLQSVALQCKAHTSLTSGPSNTFHFHPLTFEL